jgi:prepilin-type processing-associated H-X9-DG protein
MKTSTLSLSGRVTIATLALISILLGFAYFGNRAHAQGGGTMRVHDFGVVSLEQNSSQNGNTAILIGLLLPAVKRLTTPFRIEVMNDDTDIVMGLNGSSGKRVRYFEVFMTTDGKLQYLNVKNLDTGELRTKATKVPEVGVRLLPAVQDGTVPVDFITGNLSVRGSANISFADGSVAPVPFQLFPPMIEHEINF